MPQFQQTGGSHFDPGEARDWHGRWTTQADSFVPSSREMSPECREEWEHAQRFCDDLLRRNKLGALYGGYGFGRSMINVLWGRFRNDAAEIRWIGARAHGGGDERRLRDE
jgi:hypothetical protein